jgi:hypothetical protein
MTVPTHVYQLGKPGSSVSKKGRMAGVWVYGFLTCSCPYKASGSKDWDDSQGSAAV